MRTSLSLLVLTFFSLSVAFASQNITQNATRFTLSQKCSASPLYVLNEEYYQGHPFRDVNLARDPKHWRMSKYNVEFNSMQNYTLRKKVGSGTFSSVFKTTYIPDGTQYVFKQLVEDDIRAMKKEIQVMKEIADLPNVLPIRDMIREEGDDNVTRSGLILDYFSIISYREMFKTLNKMQIKNFIYETLRTLSLAHSRGIVHRDIKPLNVLMNAERGEVRVIDWGQSDFYLPNKWYPTTISSFYYMAPELMLGYHYHDYALDMWSTGCMLAEMVFNKNTFFKGSNYTARPGDDSLDFTMKDDQRNKEQLTVVAKVMGTLKLKQYANKFKSQMKMQQIDEMPDYKKVPLTEFINEKNAHLVDSTVIDLLEKMLTYDHTKRITSTEALMHPYFDEVRQGTVSDHSESSEKVNLSKWTNVITQARK